MVLLIDNFDSFTWNLYHYIGAAGKHCKTVRNTDVPFDELDLGLIKGIVISPGPQSPADHVNIFTVLEKYHNKIPILGICLGFQAIGAFYGGKVEKAPAPVHGKTALVNHTGHRAFKNVPSPFKATRYHSLIINADIPKELDIIAKTEDNLVMSIAHKEHLVWGHQFHPEAILTEQGEQIVENWLSLLS